MPATAEDFAQLDKSTGYNSQQASIPASDFAAKFAAAGAPIPAPSLSPGANLNVPEFLKPLQTILPNIVGSGKQLVTGIGQLGQGLAKGAKGDIKGAADISELGAENAVAAPFNAAGAVVGGVLNSGKELANTLSGGLVNKGADAIISKLSDYISNNPDFQKFAMANPNAGEHFSNLLSIALGAAGAGKDVGIKNAVGDAAGSAGEFAGKVGDLANVAGEKIVNTKIAPFEGSYNPEVAKMFESEGIKPPVSAISKSPFIQGSEAVASKSLFGQSISDIVHEAGSKIESKTNSLVDTLKPSKVISDENLGKTIQEGIQKYQDKFDNDTNNIINRIRPKKSLSDEELGKSVQEGLKQFEDNFKLTEGKIYDDFSKTYGKSNVYGMDTKNALNTLIKEQGNDYFGGVDNRLTKMLNRITGADNPEIRSIENQIAEAKVAGAKPKVIEPLEKELASTRAKFDKNLSFEELKETRSSVGERLQKEPEDTALKRLYGALTKDMYAAVQKAAETPFGNEAKIAAQSLDRLNEGYRTGKAKIESNIAQSIKMSNPEKIVPNLITRNSAGMLDTLKEMIGEEKFSGVSDSFLRKQFDDAVTNGKFDLQKFKDNMNGFDMDTIKSILGPEKINNVKATIKALEDLDSQKINSPISEGNAEKVAKNIIKRNSAGTLISIKKMIGPEKFSEISKSFLRQQFEDSIVRGKFDVSKFKNNISSYDKETIAQILSPQELKILNEGITRLDKLDTMAKSMKQGQKYAQGSQTAFLANISAHFGGLSSALFSGHPLLFLTGLGEIAGEYGISKLFTTNFGKKLLTEGIKPFKGK